MTAAIPDGMNDPETGDEKPAEPRRPRAETGEQPRPNDSDDEAQLAEALRRRRRELEALFAS